GEDDPQGIVGLVCGHVAARERGGLEDHTLERREFQCVAFPLEDMEVKGSCCYSDKNYRN
ncbi:MAG: hypothetical protein MUP22_03265, partial [Desulfobacterales bacterium]|nr:hypothetical protein [Desulfobacterales bacterium]